MTPEQLERLAANRIQHMGYPDELSDAERWHRFRGDAELVAASNDVLWERVRELRERLADAETEKIERGTEIIRLREFIAHTYDYYGERMPWQWKAHARATLAGGSDG